MNELAYGSIINNAYVVSLNGKDKLEQLKYIKELWLKNPILYSQWKQWCIDSGFLPELFGTRDNPIHIDESKL